MSSESHASSPKTLPLRNFSRVEYDKMIDAGTLGEDEHVELVDGVMVAMSPEGPPHSATIDLCADVLRRAFGDAFTVRVQHPLVIDPDGEPEPDLVVVAGSPFDYFDEHPRTAALVVEVAGSSLAYDRREKTRLYARSAIPEYWIVNLVDRVVEIHRSPSADGYQDVSSVGPSGTISPLAAPAATIVVGSFVR
jgi:Uma2 family endonuclease